MKLMTRRQVIDTWLKQSKNVLDSDILRRDSFGYYCGNCSIAYTKEGEERQ